MPPSAIETPVERVVEALLREGRETGVLCVGSKGLWARLTVSQRSGKPVKHRGALLKAQRRALCATGPVVQKLRTVCQQHGASNYVQRAATQARKIVDQDRIRDLCCPLHDQQGSACKLRCAAADVRILQVEASVADDDCATSVNV